MASLASHSPFGWVLETKLEELRVILLQEFQQHLSLALVAGSFSQSHEDYRLDPEHERILPHQSPRLFASSAIPVTPLQTPRLELAGSTPPSPGLHDPHAVEPSGAVTLFAQALSGAMGDTPHAPCITCHSPSARHRDLRQPREQKTPALSAEASAQEGVGTMLHNASRDQLQVLHGGAPGVDHARDPNGWLPTPSTSTPVSALSGHFLAQQKLAQNGPQIAGGSRKFGKESGTKDRVKLDIEPSGATTHVGNTLCLSKSPSSLSGPVTGPSQNSLLEAEPNAPGGSTGSSGCGSVFVVKSAWQLDAVEAASNSLMQKLRKKLLPGLSTHSVGTASIGSDASQDSAEGGATWISHPTAPWRVLWNLGGLLAVAYDFIFIPMVLMEPPDWHIINILGFLTQLFWNVDIPANFCVGYYNGKGELVVRPYLVARNYAQSWLVLDVSLIGLDWVLFAMKDDAAGQSFGKAGKTLRMTRFLRILRLLRLLKIPAFAVPVRDRVSYGITTLYMNIAKILIGILAINHVLACFWYGIANSDHRKGWITDAIQHRSFGFRYLLSYHWCLAQFGTGSSAVYPSNEKELGFAAWTSLMGLLLASYMVSIMTDAMVCLQRLRHEQNHLFSTFRRYCCEAQVSKDLFGRTLKYLEHAYLERRRQMLSTDVQLLSLLSGPLKNELQLEVWFPFMSSHRFFNFLCRKETSAMQHVCQGALGEKHFAQEDKIFSAGEMATHMFFVMEGDLVYLKRDSPAQVWVNKKEWVSEAAVWTHWFHVGLFSAKTESRLLELDVDAFGVCVRGHSVALSKVQRYAERYVMALNKSHLSQISDVEAKGIASRFQMIIMPSMVSIGSHRSTLSDEQAGFPLWRRLCKMIRQ